MKSFTLVHANVKINEVYVVGVKNHLREEGKTQLQTIIKNSDGFHQSIKEKKLFGILAVVDMTTELKERVLLLVFIRRISEKVCFF